MARPPSRYIAKATQWSAKYYKSLRSQYFGCVIVGHSKRLLLPPRYIQWELTKKVVGKMVPVMDNTAAARMIARTVKNVNEVKLTK